MEDKKYRNENNRIIGDGKWFVASYDTGNALFIGTYAQCEKYLEEHLDGDDDDYGIFEN